MHGNVVELTSDLFQSFSSEAIFDPTGPGSGGGYVRKGGSWFPSPDFLRSASRLSTGNSIKSDYMGFRLALRDLNKAPKDLNSTAVLAVLENLPAGQVIGELNATDPDANSSISYHFVNGDNNNSLFTLDTNGTLKTATTFDYESNASTTPSRYRQKTNYNATTEGILQYLAGC